MMMLATDLPFVQARDGEMAGAGYTYLKAKEAAVDSPAAVWNILRSAEPASLMSEGNWTDTVPKIPSDVYDKTLNNVLRLPTVKSAETS